MDSKPFQFSIEVDPTKETLSECFGVSNERYEELHKLLHKRIDASDTWADTISLMLEKQDIQTTGELVMISYLMGTHKMTDILEEAVGGDFEEDEDEDLDDADSDEIMEMVAEQIANVLKKKSPKSKVKVVGISKSKRHTTKE